MSLEHSPARAGKDARASVDPSFTVDEFCRAERMSRSALYKQWQQGKGPRFYLVGNSRRQRAGAVRLSARSRILCGDRNSGAGEAVTRPEGASATQREDAAPTKCPPPWLATEAAGEMSPTKEPIPRQVRQHYRPRKRG
jgi:hypothetical protein